jgi:LysM repeat protein
MARYQGKHRKPSNTARNVARMAVAGAVVATPIAVSAPANAADWDSLAKCESSGNWSANTGNGFSGGLQFTQSTWKAYGGGQYASNAKDASREEQIQVAEKVLQAQGTKAWPGCSSKTSWSSGSSDSSSSKSSSAKSSSSSDSSKKSSSSKQGKSSSVRSKGADYTVQQGDTLGKIAQKYGVKYQDVFERNTNTLKDPNTIFPGQQLEIR